MTSELTDIILHNWAAMFYAKRKLNVNMTDEEIDIVIDRALKKFQLIPYRKGSCKRIKLSSDIMEWVLEQNENGITLNMLAKELNISLITLKRRKKDYETNVCIR